jgi:hypothetical protein
MEGMDLAGLKKFVSSARAAGPPGAPNIVFFDSHEC